MGAIKTIYSLTPGGIIGGAVQVPGHARFVPIEDDPDPAERVRGEARGEVTGRRDLRADRERA